MNYYRVESCELPGKQNLCVAGWTVKKNKKAKNPQICQIQYQWLGHLLCHLLNVLWFKLIGRAGYMKMIVFILKTFHPSLWEQDDYLSRKKLTSDYQLQHPSFNRLAVAISIFKWVCTAGFNFFFFVFILFLEVFFFLFFCYSLCHKTQMAFLSTNCFNLVESECCFSFLMNSFDTTSLKNVTFSCLIFLSKNFGWILQLWGNLSNAVKPYFFYLFKTVLNI